MLLNSLQARGTPNGIVPSTKRSDPTTSVVGVRATVPCLSRKEASASGLGLGPARRIRLSNFALVGSNGTVCSTAISRVELSSLRSFASLASVSRQSESFQRT